MPRDIDKYTPNDDLTARVVRSFVYHAPKGDQQARYVHLRDMAKVLAMDILTMVPPGREQATAITKLEEAIMWANKGIACGEP